MSVNSTNPGNIWGGTWVAWGSGRVPVGINTSDGNFNAAEKTGGASAVNLSHSHSVNSHNHTTANCTLTVNQMPAHTHAEYMSYLNNESTGDVQARIFAAAQTTSGNTGSYKALPQATAATLKSCESGALQTGGAGGNGAHNHGNTGNSAPGTNSQLGNTSVLQPYITCYMWKRTA